MGLILRKPSLTCVPCSVSIGRIVYILGVWYCIWYKIKRWAIGSKSYGNLIHSPWYSEIKSATATGTVSFHVQRGHWFFRYGPCYADDQTSARNPLYRTRQTGVGWNWVVRVEVRSSYGTVEGKHDDIYMSRAIALKVSQLMELLVELRTNTTYSDVSVIFTEAIM